MQLEIRSFTELGAPKVTGEREIEGYAVVFNQESRIMYDKESKRFFIEIIESGAITDELLKRCDIKAVLNHNEDRLLARSYNGVGTLHLEIDEYGLKYRFSAPDTPDGAFAIEMVKRGDLFGSSFAFYTNDKDSSKVSYSKRGDLIVRKVHTIDYISDVCPVINPAYFGTNVNTRSIETIESLLCEPTSDYLEHINNLEKLI